LLTENIIKKVWLVTFGQSDFEQYQRAYKQHFSKEP